MISRIFFAKDTPFGRALLAEASTFVAEDRDFPFVRE